MLLALKTLWVGQVVVTLNLASLAVTPAPIGPPTITFGAFDVAGVTTLTSETIRPSDPDAMGDQDTTTYATGSITASGAGQNILPKVTAPVIDDVAPGAIGAIQHLVFHVFGVLEWSLGTQPTVNGQKIRWTVGANTGEIAVTPFPVLTMEFLDPPLSQYFVERVSDPVTAQPNGNPWTWAAINNLVNVEVEGNYTSTGIQHLRIDIAEIWIEVLGQGGGAGSRRKIKVKLGMGSPIDALILGMPVLRLAPPVIEEVGLTIGTARQKLSLSGPMSFTLVMA